MPPAARLPRTPSVVDACFAALDARRSAATGVVSEAQAGAFLVQDFNGPGFMMPLAVFELEPRTGRTSNLKETDRTPILQQIFKSLGKSDLMKVPLGWDYASNPEPKAMLQEALSELLLAIMSIPGGTEYTAIYVKKVHGERDAGQPPPSAASEAEACSALHQPEWS